MIGIMKLLLPLLLLFSAFVVPTTSKSKNRHESAAASSSLERGARVNKKWNAHHSHAAVGVMQQRSNVTPTASHHEGGQSATSSDRRVIPWVSIAILMNILFFFRSFAAPFFDPLVSGHVSILSLILCHLFAQLTCQYVHNCTINVTLLLVC